MNETIDKIISSDNTKQVKYIILFFIFVIALSQNTFKNLFGCDLNSYFNNFYVKHLISIFFLFLIVDMNLNSKDNTSSLIGINPLFSLIYSVLIYSFVFLLLHCNKVYILFIMTIIFFLVVLDRIKYYFEVSITDQEILQERLSFIYKMNNMFVIIILLTIIIGSLTTLDVKRMYKTIMNLSC